MALQREEGVSDSVNSLHCCHIWNNTDGDSYMRSAGAGVQDTVMTCMYHLSQASVAIGASVLPG